MDGRLDEEGRDEGIWEREGGNCDADWLRIISVFSIRGVGDTGILLPSLPAQIGISADDAHVVVRGLQQLAGDLDGIG